MGKTARETYSNYNQMRAYVECSSNQARKLTLKGLVGGGGGVKMTPSGFF